MSRARDGSVRDRLFALQLRLKKHKVNKARKLAETARLQVSCEEQIRDYLFSLYQSSVSIWSIIHSTTTELISTPISMKQAISPEFGDSEVAQAISDFKAEPTIILADETFLSLPSFLRLLFSYAYLWSRESLDDFQQFLSSQSPSFIPILSESLLVHPLTQIYFQTALRPVFRKLQSGGDLVQLLNDSIVTTAPLMPVFLRSLIADFPAKHVLFFDSFLRHFVVHCALFGIADPELQLFVGDRLASFLDALTAFFHSDAALPVVESVITCPRQMSILPSELSLASVCPNYEPLTLVDSEDSDQLFFVALTGSAHLSPQRSSLLQTDSLPAVVRRFLLAADLTKVEQDFSTPFEYFAQISALSSVYGEPTIELELDKLQQQIAAQPNLRMEGLLAEIEELLALEDQNAIEDPLGEISIYSSQFSCIKRLKVLVDQATANAKVYINFLKIRKFVESLLAVPKVMPFIDVYTTACGSLATVIAQPDFMSYRSLFSLIARAVGLELLPNERDSQVQEFLRTHKTALIDSQQQPFLQVYRDNPKRLDLFMGEFAYAFGTDMPFVRIAHIHCAYQILNGLLEMQGVGEVGADQLVPFAILATVCANPLGLASTCTFLGQYVEPLSSCGSPVDHQQEYSVIQFMSTCQFLFDKMAEAEEGQ
jgi:ABC-type tungstate transport system substrate-binding protein